MQVDILGTIIGQIKDAKAALAEASLRLPSREHSDYLVSAGKWQGLDEALQIIDSILSEGEKKDVPRERVYE